MKDTCSRWWEQPSSLLSRLFVGVLLTMVATVILIAFNLMERNLRHRLERFGLDTVVVRDMVSTTDPEITVAGERADRLAYLSELGEKTRLRQLYVRAKSELMNDMIVFSYPPSPSALLTNWVRPGKPIVHITDDLPAGLELQFTLDRSRGVALVQPMDNMLRPLAMDHVLLVPQGWAHNAERLGYIDTTILRRSADAPSIQKIVASVLRLYQVENKTPPQIQSALPIVRELDELRTRQQQWRAVLAGVLGVTLALVFGSIAVLEFRQNLFISALLRSFGAPGKFLYFRQWIENAFLANLAAATAVTLVATFHEQLFGALGFPNRVLNFAEGNPYWSSEVALIFLWINVGAFLSSLPVAVGLRKPIGAVLN